MAQAEWCAGPHCPHHIDLLYFEHQGKGPAFLALHSIFFTWPLFPWSLPWWPLGQVSQGLCVFPAGPACGQTWQRSPTGKLQMHGQTAGWLGHHRPSLQGLPSAGTLRACKATLSYPHLTFLSVSFCLVQTGWLRCFSLDCLVPVSGSDPGQATRAMPGSLQAVFWMRPGCPSVLTLSRLRQAWAIAPG